MSIFKKSVKVEKPLIFLTKSESETIDFGKRLGRHLKLGDVIALFGPLGAGKTCLVKGIAQGLGVKNTRAVRSPSFTLVHEYRGRLKLYHIDAYRLEGYKELEALGPEEFFWGEGASVIEWADRVTESLPREYLKVSISIVSPEERQFELEALGQRYMEILRKLR